MRAAFLIFSAAVAGASSIPSCLNGATVFDASTDYFPDQPLPLNAQYFSITYHKYYKVLSVFESLTSAATRYALVMCGAPAPPNVSSFAATFTVPVAKGVGVSSTTMLPLFELLGRLDALAVFGSDPEYISSPCVKAQIASGATVAAYTGTWPSTDNVTLASKDVSVFFAEIGSPEYYHMAAWPEALERSSLASLDYVFFLAAFLNEERQANRVVASARQRYECSVEEVKSALSQDSKYSLRMNILWAYWVGEYGTNVWWVGSCPNYYCELAGAIGGQILTPDHFGMKPSRTTDYETYSDEEFLKMAVHADLFIYVGTNFSVVQAAKGKILAAIPAYASGRVYDTAGHGASDWFEWRYAEPDLLLQEIFAAALPLASSHNRVFLRRVLASAGGLMEDVKTRSVCKASAAPAQTLASACPGTVKIGALIVSDDSGKDGSRTVTIAVPVAVGGTLLLTVAALLTVILMQRHAIQGYRRANPSGGVPMNKVEPL